MIPNIIHQIWEGASEPLPEFLKELGSTWKNNHPSWSYEFWDKDKMNSFVEDNYPDFLETYLSYPYPVQRWDAIRYLILYKIGGLYVDFDYESIEPIDKYIVGKKCVFSLDPVEHNMIFNKSLIITNALMGIEPRHPFMKVIIDNLSLVSSKAEDKINYVLETTGPFFITKLYELYLKKEEIYLFPIELTTPLTQAEVNLYIKGRINEKILDQKLRKAICVHYFFGSWYK